MLTHEAKRRIVKYLCDGAKNKEEKSNAKSWVESGASVSVPEENAEVLRTVQAMSPASPILEAEGYHHVFINASPELRPEVWALTDGGAVEIWFLRDFARHT